MIPKSNQFDVISTNKNNILKRKRNEESKKEKQMKKNEQFAKEIRSKAKQERITQYRKKMH